MPRKAPGEPGEDPTNELTLEDGSPANRRRSARVPFRVWAENHGFEEFCIWLAAEDISKDFKFCYRTSDLSPEGVFLETNTPLEAGTEMDLAFRLPDDGREVRVQGEVVRIVARGDPSGPAGMAVLFREVDPAVRARIDAWVLSRG